MLWRKTMDTQTKHEWVEVTHVVVSRPTRGPVLPLGGFGASRVGMGTRVNPDCCSEKWKIQWLSWGSLEKAKFSLALEVQPHRQVPFLICWQLECHIQHIMLHLVQGDYWTQCQNSRYQACRSFYSSHIGSPMVKTSTGRTLKPQTSLCSSTHPVRISQLTGWNNPNYLSYDYEGFFWNLEWRGHVHQNWLVSSSFQIQAERAVHFWACHSYGKEEIARELMGTYNDCLPR